MSSPKYGFHSLKRNKIRRPFNYGFLWKNTSFQNLLLFIINILKPRVFELRCVMATLGMNTIQSVATDSRKEFQCLTIVLNNKTGPFVFENQLRRKTF